MYLLRYTLIRNNKISNREISKVIREENSMSEKEKYTCKTIKEAGENINTIFENILRKGSTKCITKFNNYSMRLIKINNKTIREIYPCCNKDRE